MSCTCGFCLSYTVFGEGNRRMFLKHFWKHVDDCLHFREKSWVGRLSAKTGRALSEWRGQGVMLLDTRMHTRGSGAGELGGRSPGEWSGEVQHQGNMSTLREDICPFGPSREAPTSKRLPGPSPQPSWGGQLSVFLTLRSQVSSVLPFLPALSCSPTPHFPIVPPFSWVTRHAIQAVTLSVEVRSQGLLSSQAFLPM